MSLLFGPDPEEKNLIPNEIPRLKRQIKDAVAQKNSAEFYLGWIATVFNQYKSGYLNESGLSAVLKTILEKSGHL